MNRLRRVVINEVSNTKYDLLESEGGRNITDTDLMRALEKEDNSISWPDFNKVLLDLEIYGLIRVSWLTKDKRRIEIAEGKAFKIETVDSVD